MTAQRVAGRDTSAPVLHWGIAVAATIAATAVVGFALAVVSILNDTEVPW